MEATALKPACPTCRGAGFVIQTAGEYAAARPCTCQSTCSKCEGSGRVYETRDGYQFLGACDCQQVRQGIQLHNAAKLPAIVAGCDFAGFETRGYLNDAKQKSFDYAQAFKPGQTSGGLLLSGPVGTGKTHLLAAILRHLTLQARVSCRFVEISHLYSEIRNGFSQNRSSLDIIAPLAEVPVLAIDELGKGKMSPFEQETIDELVSRRYNGGRATLFATNYSTVDEQRPPRAPYSTTAERLQEQRSEQALKERVGERVFSRLRQMCVFVDIPSSAPDYRRLKPPRT